MGQGYYAVTDTDATYADGQHTGALSADAEHYADGIKSDATAVEAGRRNGCAAVTTAAHDLGAELFGHARAVARELQNLGTATSAVGVTTEATSNETTSAQNTAGTLSRSVNATNSRPIAV
ncbi:MAG: hypothetical protein Q7T56_00660 [Nocardioidaceae bacterium]|nr:hypothetical protein [Nocardioidaceae bacterium]